MLCEECNQEFSVKRNGKRANGRRFCSHKCSQQFQKQESAKRELIGSYPGTKRCGNCDNIKPAGEFGIRDRRKFRLSSYCRQCMYLAQMRRWNRNKIRAIEYLGGICSICMKSKHPALFDFHHLTDDKEVEWTKLRLRSWDKIKIELDKCTLMCCECHRLHHINPNLW